MCLTHGMSLVEQPLKGGGVTLPAVTRKTDKGLPDLRRPVCGRRGDTRRHPHWGDRDFVAFDWGILPIETTITGDRKCVNFAEIRSSVRRPLAHSQDRRGWLSPARDCPSSSQRLATRSTCGVKKSLIIYCKNHLVSGPLASKDV